jgi:subtilisin family serine protease
MNGLFVECCHKQIKRRLAVKKLKSTKMLLLFVLILFVTTTFGQKSRNFNPLTYDVEVMRERLAQTLETTAMNSSLPEILPYWVDMVNAEVVSNDGEGVYVAVLDTGLLSPWPFFFSEATIREDLGKGFSHDIDWDSGMGGFAVSPLKDDRGFITDDFMGSGHGTHVASTIVGYNYNNMAWIRGVAPKAQIIPVLVLDAWAVPYPGGTAYFSGGTDEMISAGIYYIADLADTLDGPVIISMSLGGPDPSPMIEEAINFAIDKGVIVVVAAGNTGDDGMDWPGAYTQVISCGMAGWTETWVPDPNFWLNDVPEDFKAPDTWGNNWQLYLDYMSSRPNRRLGQKSYDLDVSAPGVAIVGPYKPYFSYAMDYYYLWGTSMATPHVSSIASLVLQSHADFDQFAMEKVLKLGARGLPLPCDGALALDVPGLLYYFEWKGTDWGGGFLQADAALKKAKNKHK